MGNTLTVASVNATELIIPVTEGTITKPKSHVGKNFDGEPPPECPMHKPAQKPEKFVSECPIDHMKDSDVNPLNMVRNLNPCLFEYFLFVPSQIEILSGLTDRSVYPLLYSILSRGL